MAFSSRTPSKTKGAAEAAPFCFFVWVLLQTGEFLEKVPVFKPVLLG
jgi:hypothetical protein